MDIEYKGANCVVLSTKQSTIVVDPALSQVGLKDVTIKDAIEVVTAENFAVKSPSWRLAIEGPGEYEVADVSIKGIPAARHIDHNEGFQATMYQMEIGGVRLGVIGHVTAHLTDEQLEQLGTIDVLIIPVGGSGYTLDSHDAATLTRRIGPKIVIPTHFNDEAVTYEVPQGELEPFVKELSAPHESLAKLKLKNGVLPEVLTVVEVARTT